MFHEINNDVKIDFSVPMALQELIDMAEEADQAGSIGKYYAYVDAIDTTAKNCYASGAITKKQWETILNRYV